MTIAKSESIFGCSSEVLALMSRNEANSYEAMYLTEQQVSKILSCSLSKLRQDRLRGRGLAYSRYGRSIRYSLEDIISAMRSNRVEPRELT